MFNQVLPPWGRLYHWQSRDLSKPQVRIPWSDFFDVSSIARFVPVQDLVDHISLTGDDSSLAIDQVFYLQNYKEGWGEKYEEKHDFRDCIDNMDRYYRQDGEGGPWEGYFWGHGDVITAKVFRCLSAQGSATSLAPLIEETPGKALPRLSVKWLISLTDQSNLLTI